jgi:hypothetical protein
MAIGDVFSLAVTAQFAGVGSEFVNVHHFRQATDLVNSEPGLDLTLAWGEFVQPLLVPLHSIFVEIVQLTVRQPSNPAYVFEVAVTGAPGTTAGDMVPPQAAPVCSWRTGLAGRSRRGRTYMFPTGEVHQNGGTLSGTYLSPWDTWATQMLSIPAGVTHASWQLVIHSDTLNQDFPVTSFVLNNIMGTQRRRRSGVGS